MSACIWLQMHLYNIYSNFIGVWAVFVHENGNRSLNFQHFVWMCASRYVSVANCQRFHIYVYLVLICHISNLHRNWSNSSTSKKLQTQLLIATFGQNSFGKTKVIAWCHRTFHFQNHFFTFFFTVANCEKTISLVPFLADSLYIL